MRFLELWIIWFKEELKIADLCKAVKSNILSSLTNTELFSEEYGPYFDRVNPNVPYAIQPTDPTQIAVIKKIINALEHTEKVMRAVEQLDINRDRFKAGIAIDAFSICYHAVDEAYAALQLINNSSADIQNILSPHLKTLLPQLALASEQLKNYAPQHPGEIAGAGLGQIVRMLPRKEHTQDEALGHLSTFIYQLPIYFSHCRR